MRESEAQALRLAARILATFEDHPTATADSNGHPDFTVLAGVTAPKGEHSRTRSGRVHRFPVATTYRERV